MPAQKKQMNFEEAWVEVAAMTGGEYFVLEFEAQNTGGMDGIVTKCSIFFYRNHGKSFRVSAPTWDSVIDAFRVKMFPVATLHDIYDILPHMIPQEVAAQ